MKNACFVFVFFMLDGEIENRKGHFQTNNRKLCFGGGCEQKVLLQKWHSLENSLTLVVFGR